MRLGSQIAAGIVALNSALATAEPPQVVVGTPTIDDLAFARQPIAPVSSATVAQSKIIYLNRTGATLVPGDNDARTNHSTLVAAQTAIPGWSPSQAMWTGVVSCMREVFAGFDVTVVDTDPGNVPHIEAVFGGAPSMLGLASNIGGVSPFTTDCSIIDNAIVFAFTQILPNDARTVCEIMAQEVAHAYGLDHELLPRDPMTYLPYGGNRSFQNQHAQCGEDKPRPCGFQGSTCRDTQNSLSLLIERLGRRGAPGDTTAPTIEITSPANHAYVPPGFNVEFTASDANGIKFASLYLDGKPSGSVSAPPYTFATPVMAEGTHELKIEVTDGANQKSQTISVIVRTGAEPPAAIDDDVVGGCSTGRGATLAAALALLGLRRRRISGTTRGC